MFARCIRVPTSFSQSAAALTSLRCYRDHGNQASSGRGDQLPTKDRYPPKAYDPQNPKRRLAVLIDGSKVEAAIFHKVIQPALSEVGSPILVRVFDHQLNDNWQRLLADSNAPSPSTSASPMEWFRVERFIPVSMQMGADANHIFEFRSFNKLEAVCYVCTELERPKFELLLPRIAKNGFNQYLFDEMGLGVELLEDNRSRDGS